ncbi:hypothetical protein TcCL_ESM11350 [Trypanosoma cruzi]|nr:hypothetical protein TcCL_ESM11350 [Trypanosoma cruzi]
MPYHHLVPPHRQATREELCAPEIQPISNKKSNRADTAHAYGKEDPLKWMFSYWASNAGRRPRRRKRIRLAAQRRPHRKSIECCHGSSRGKQKKQRTGTSSSSSVITGSRRRGLLAVRLAASVPAAKRRFSRSVGASWPDPLLLCRWMLLRNSRVDILRWCAAVGPNALRNGDGRPWQSFFSRCL